MTDDIQRSLGRIEGKLDAIIAAQIVHEAEDKKRFDGYSKRIGSLERSRAWLTGAIGATAAGIGASVYHFFTRG